MSSAGALGQVPSRGHGRCRRCGFRTNPIHHDRRLEASGQCVEGVPLSSDWEARPTLAVLLLCSATFCVYWRRMWLPKKTKCRVGKKKKKKKPGGKKKKKKKKKS